MRITKAVTYVTLTAALSAVSAFGQSVISAKAGVIHYTEGDVQVGSGNTMTQVEVRFGGRYDSMKDGSSLATGEGRAEVLLTPGVFLRLGENSAFTLISGSLSDTRFELTRGVALIEVTEASKESPVTMLVKDTSLTFAKMGLIRVDAASGIRVYKGETQIIAGSTPQTLKEGRELNFSGNTIAKFDTKAGDPLYRWANRRAEYIAMANIASANMAQQGGFRNNSAFGLMGGWIYNPYYGMMTYLPMNGMYRSPFGYFYYSPDRVSRYYENYITPPSSTVNAGYGGGAGNRTWNQDNGYYTTQSRSAGAVSMPSSGSTGSASATAVAAPAARGADVGTGRGGGSGASGK